MAREEECEALTRILPLRRRRCVSAPPTLVVEQADDCRVSEVMRRRCARGVHVDPAGALDAASPVGELMRTLTRLRLQSARPAHPPTRACNQLPQRCEKHENRFNPK